MDLGWSLEEGLTSESFPLFGALDFLNFLCDLASANFEWLNLTRGFLGLERFKVKSLNALVASFLKLMPVHVVLGIGHTISRRESIYGISLALSHHRVNRCLVKVKRKNAIIEGLIGRNNAEFGVGVGKLRPQ